jgi:hypothetical protein
VWDDTDGWSEPGACEWSCDTGFGEVDGACLDQILVECRPDDEAPPFSSPRT